jgi:L-fuconolactonase
LGGGVTAIVDAHVHFWDPRLLDYPWLETLPSLRRAFGPADYAAAVGDVAVRQLVVVEGNCAPDENVRETTHFDRLGETAPIAGIVAAAMLTDDAGVDRALDVLSQSRKVKGIRHSIQGQPPGFCLQRSFVDGVQKVGRLGLTFDLCVTYDQLGDAAELVRRNPDTTFVLDHCGKPAIRERCLDPWRRDLARLASFGNVWCKMSGLLTEADTNRWQPADLLPYAEYVVECFSTGRVMYGSDWPVLTLAGDYRDWYDFTESLSAHWSATERCGFYHDNAARAYRL